jgi:hypothetical protein
MNGVKETIKNTLPAPLYNALREGRDGLVRAAQWPMAALHPWRRDSIRRLGALKDRHRGERCFIIGNGPSLKQTDLSRLRNEFTLGQNRIYLAFPEIGFTTTYYLSVNDLVVQQCAAEIDSLAMPLFISWRARKWLKPQPNLYFIHTTYTGEKFATDIRGRIWEGGTVTYTSLQVAYYLGFEQVILVGVDHNYVTQGRPNATVVSEGDDPNHFHPGYFGKGYRWQLPDLVQWEEAYRLARRTYEAGGRSVVDATIGGKLRVFPKVAYDSLF